MDSHFVSRFYVNLFESQEISKHVYRMLLPQLHIDSKPKSTKSECVIVDYNTEMQEPQSNQRFEDIHAKEIYRLIKEVENSKSSHNLVEDAILTEFICFLKANNPTFRENVKAIIDTSLKISLQDSKVSTRNSDTGFEITRMFTELMVRYFSEWKFIIAYNPDENVRLITSDNPVIFLNPDKLGESAKFEFAWGIPKEIGPDSSINISAEKFEFIQNTIVYFPLTPNICVSGYPDWESFEKYGRECSLPQVYNQLVFLHANNRIYSNQRSILVDIRNEVLNSGRFNYDENIVKKERGSE